MLLLSLSRGSRREQDIEMDVYAQFEAALLFVDCDSLIQTTSSTLALAVAVADEQLPISCSAALARHHAQRSPSLLFHLFNPFSRQQQSATGIKNVIPLQHTHSK